MMTRANIVAVAGVIIFVAIVVASVSLDRQRSTTAQVSGEVASSIDTDLGLDRPTAGACIQFEGPRSINYVLRNALLVQTTASTPTTGTVAYYLQTPSLGTPNQTLTYTIFNDSSISAVGEADVAGEQGLGGDSLPTHVEMTSDGYYCSSVPETVPSVTVRVSWTFQMQEIGEAKYAAALAGRRRGSRLPGLIMPDPQHFSIFTGAADTSP